MQPCCVSIAAAALLFSLQVVTGQGLTCNGACVGTWKKCAGEGISPETMRPCCSAGDQCVEKTASYSQCRPKSKDVPASWPSGAILTCTEPEGCDPTAINGRIPGLSAGRFASNGGIQLGFFYLDELDYQSTTCLEACQDHEDCFAFNEAADNDCTLFGKNLFTTAGDLQPFFDSEIIFTKCYLPEPLCDPATPEVRQVHSTVAADGGPHQMDGDYEKDHFSVSIPGYAVTAGINACRLNDGRPGRCIGFAVEDIPGRSQPRVTLLYPAGPRTRDYNGVNPKVYSIEACP